jgi:phosphatidylinositol alpha-mannosyltransferase
VRLLIAGPGDVDDVREAVPPSLRSQVGPARMVSDEDKPRVFASGTVYCAPNTHGESFGIVLVEAMSAGTPVVASDLEAFRRVLDDGAYGVLVPVRDAGALAARSARCCWTPSGAPRCARPPAAACRATTGPPSPGRSSRCTRRSRRASRRRAGRRGPLARGRAAAGRRATTTTTPAAW